MRRGLTLLELLLAMMLLAGIAAAVIPLTRSVIGGMQQIDQKLLWRRSAENALGEIDRQLLQRQRSSSVEETVRVENDRLIITLTNVTSVRFGMDQNDFQLTASSNANRVLIGRVGEALFTFDDERQVLLVRLKCDDGEIAERSWGLAR